MELESRRGALLLHKAAWNAQQPHSRQMFSLMRPRADAVWIVIYPSPHAALVRYISTGGGLSLVYDNPYCNAKFRRVLIIAHDNRKICDELTPLKRCL